MKLRKSGLDTDRSSLSLCVCAWAPGPCMLNKTFNERALITARNWLVDRVSSSLSLLLMQITGSDYSDYTPTLPRHVAGRSKPRPLSMIKPVWFACIQCLSEGQTFPPLGMHVLFRLSCPYIHTHSRTRSTHSFPPHTMWSLCMAAHAFACVFYMTVMLQGRGESFWHLSSIEMNMQMSLSDTQSHITFT